MSVCPSVCLSIHNIVQKVNFEQWFGPLKVRMRFVRGSKSFSCLLQFLCATAGTAIARLSHRNSVRLSVCHTGGSGKNGAR